MANKATEKESVRVDKDVVQQVRAYVVNSKHKIGGFFALAAKEKLNRLKKNKDA